MLKIKDKACLIEMKINSFILKKYILQSQLNQFIQENPQYDYIKIVPEKVKVRSKKK